MCTFSLCFLNIWYGFTLTGALFACVWISCATILICVNRSPFKWNMSLYSYCIQISLLRLLFFFSAFKCSNFKFSMQVFLEITVLISSSSSFFCIDDTNVFQRYSIGLRFRNYRYLHFYMRLRGIYNVDQTEMIFWLYQTVSNKYSLRFFDLNYSRIFRNCDGFYEYPTKLILIIL